MRDSLLDLRRRAPLHFEAKADNARFVAYLLGNALPSEVLEKAKATLPYGGTPSIATYEAFAREAAISLELIIKAVIAQNIEVGTAPKHVVRVRPTHDISKLWREAKLPPLSVDDQRLGLLVKRILVWSGRYAAPVDDESYEREEAELETLRGSASTRKLLFERALGFNWDSFDRLYQVANVELWTMRQKYYG